MTLLDDWRKILRKAWSIRLGVMAALFTGAEVVVPLFSDSMPRNVFAALSFAAVIGAVWARVVAQKAFK